MSSTETTTTAAFDSSECDGLGAWQGVTCADCHGTGLSDG